MISFNSVDEWRRFLDDFNLENIGFKKKSEITGYKITYEKQVDREITYKLEFFENYKLILLFKITGEEKRVIRNYKIENKCHLLKLLNDLNMIDLNDVILQKYKTQIDCN